MVLQEANAISTTYLRADFLPDAQRTECRKLLREYVNILLSLREPEDSEIEKNTKRLDSIHDELWAPTVSLKENNTFSVAHGLFTESLNKAIDIYTKRLNITLRSRIPMVIWTTLFYLSILSMLLRGYMNGLGNKKRAAFAAFVLILSFSAVQVLIFDLD